MAMGRETGVSPACLGKSAAIACECCECVELLAKVGIARAALAAGRSAELLSLCCKRNLVGTTCCISGAGALAVLSRILAAAAGTVGVIKPKEGREIGLLRPRRKLPIVVATLTMGVEKP